METPIVFLVFNRPETTQRVFDAIAAALPARLLVVADGPRAGRAEEAARCAEVRRIATAVDWPCRVETNFAAENMGCRARVVSGLNWAFSLEEEAIVLEDDCLPDPTFFPFCSEMLARFRDDERVGMVAGSNFVERQLRTPYSYYFSEITHIWGWATWRRAWRLYDGEMRGWPAAKAAGLLTKAFERRVVQRYWEKIYDKMHDGTGPNTWDYQWGFTMLVERMLSVAPAVNLVTNVGFGAEGTHTTSADKSQQLPLRAMTFPLQHPPEMRTMREMDALEQRIAFGITKGNYVRGKLRGARLRLTKMLRGA